MMNKILLSLLLFITYPTFATFTPQHTPVPGGVAVIPLPMTSTTPIVEFQSQRVMTIKQQNQWLAIVGLPLTIEPGEHQLIYNGKKVPFQVENKEYESQYLTVKNKRHVNPNPQDMERIGKESKLIKAALRHWREAPPTLPELTLPLEGRLSSPFGLRRFFNEQPRKPHSGVDIAAPKGTPIVAPADGVVVRRGDYFFNGNTLFLDHGQGLITMYCHMDEIQVSEGQTIKQGDQIGTIGATGRVTGPHLHWGVSLNDARIDPLLLTPSLQRLLETPPE